MEQAEETRPAKKQKVAHDSAEPTAEMPATSSPPDSKDIDDNPNMQDAEDGANEDVLGDVENVDEVEGFVVPTTLPKIPENVMALYATQGN